MQQRHLQRCLRIPRLSSPRQSVLAITLVALANSNPSVAQHFETAVPWIGSGVVNGAGDPYFDYIAEHYRQNLAPELAEEFDRLADRYYLMPSGEGKPTRVFFGQRAVSPNFGKDGFFKGASIADVAARLKSGELCNGNFKVEFHYMNGQPVVVNNRSTTTLALSGSRPTNLVDMTGGLPLHPDSPDNIVSVLKRLEEMNGRPSVTMPVRVDPLDWNSAPHMNVLHPDYHELRGSMPPAAGRPQSPFAPGVRMLAGGGVGFVGGVVGQKLASAGGFDDKTSQIFGGGIGGELASGAIFGFTTLGGVVTGAGMCINNQAMENHGLPGSRTAEVQATVDTYKRWREGKLGSLGPPTTYLEQGEPQGTVWNWVPSFFGGNWDVIGF